jgi:2',3'-cyclic-nucleotide 2'-phosphodiesterase (5'-nucleotidase family)
MKRIYYVVLSLIFALACKTHFNVQKNTASHQDLKTVTPQSQTETIIAPYQQKLSAQMNQTIVATSDVLTKDGTESNLGNFVCDAMYYFYDSLQVKSERPIVLVNRGGLRTNLPKGNVNVGNIFELMPFDNELTLVHITGTDFKKVITLIIEKKHSFKNLKIAITKNDTSITYYNQTIDAQKKYWLLTSDYLANGGDSFSCLKSATERTNLNIKLRDAVLVYCKALTRTGKLINPYTDGRFLLSN